MILKRAKLKNCIEICADLVFGYFDASLDVPECKTKKINFHYYIPLPYGVRGKIIGVFRCPPIASPVQYISAQQGNPAPRGLLLFQAFSGDCCD